MLEIHECGNSYDDIGRIYHTPAGDFYSVTTVLSNTGDKKYLEDWKNRVGEEEAERVTRVAASVGTNFHELGEAYLLKQPYPDVQWLAKHMFKTAIPVLDKNVTAVHAVEIPLWSKVAKIAGRTDAIVDWKYELAILDYKCIGHHNSKWLTDYWCQLSIYAHCLKEMYNIEAKKLILVCANKKTLTTKIFECSPHKYSREAVNRIKLFHKNLKNS